MAGRTSRSRIRQPAPSMSSLGALASGLTVSSTHRVELHRRAGPAPIRSLVQNPSLLATSGTVTVTDTLPAGLTATSIAGDNYYWTCVTQAR